MFWRVKRHFFPSPTIAKATYVWQARNTRKDISIFLLLEDINKQIYPDLAIQPPSRLIYLWTFPPPPPPSPYIPILIPHSSIFLLPSALSSSTKLNTKTQNFFNDSQISLLLNFFSFFSFPYVLVLGVHATEGIRRRLLRRTLPKPTHPVNFPV